MTKMKRKTPEISFPVFLNYTKQWIKNQNKKIKTNKTQKQLTEIFF